MRHRCQPVEEFIRKNAHATFVKAGGLEQIDDTIRRDRAGNHLTDGCPRIRGWRWTVVRKPLSDRSPHRLKVREMVTDRLGFLAWH